MVAWELNVVELLDPESPQKWSTSDLACAGLSHSAAPLYFRFACLICLLYFAQQTEC